MRLHHVQLSMSAGMEDRARTFYAQILGLSEVEKPLSLAGRGAVGSAPMTAALLLPKSI
ncbi:hypothetical protein [Arthrobacter sp. MYb227]|uniref:hypothetical protein n=1 Tax=Arthrobacter sp. MYb227 TaxID=1848601 RepID=UPI0026B8A76B|nr:hypothetical protein [Arthrobacter sp. MYb227]